jgi:hypothetical protein
VCQIHVICRRHFYEEVCVHECPTVVAQDEASKRKKCYTIFVQIGSTRDGRTVEELIATNLLQPDTNGHVKTGENIGDGMWQQLCNMAGCAGEHDSIATSELSFEFGSMERKYVKNVQWGLCDTTTTNTGPFQGCHAVLRRHMKEHANHILYFLLLCLAHPANNECEAVMRAAPLRPTRKCFSRSKRVHSETSNVPPWTALFLDDVAHFANNVPGLLEYLTRLEQRGRKVRKASVGVATRWGYYVDVVQWLLEHPQRLSFLIKGLLYFWVGRLAPDGSVRPPSTGGTDTDSDSDNHVSTAGVELCDDSDDSDDEDYAPSESGDSDDGSAEGEECLAGELASLTDGEMQEMLDAVLTTKDGHAKVAFIREMVDPTVRAWLHTFNAYGFELKRYLHFVENESDYIIFKLHRVLRMRTGLLKSLADGGKTRSPCASPGLKGVRRRGLSEHVFNSFDTQDR